MDEHEKKLNEKHAPFAAKMREAGMGEVAVAAFLRALDFLEGGGAGGIPESSIEPADDLPRHADLKAAGSADLSRLVVIKLNGGLGTGMGLERAKSLLPVRDGQTFLDLIAAQMEPRADRPAPPRLLLMNSFSTSADTRRHLADRDWLGGPDRWEIMQNQVPKVLADTLLPASHSSQPDLEWCPPGHGDIYTVLHEQKWLDRLLDEGIEYAFVSNSDNLGASPDPALLQWFSETGATFLMEVTRRTAADRKGGHLARRRSDDALILRESAQCPAADEAAFQDVSRHRFFNTNNLWLRLESLRDALRRHCGVLPLPVIRNRKTLDPRDPQSPLVFQLETAMGSAIECFSGSQAIEVGRERFAPVKTTADLLVVRSDACITDDKGNVRLDSARGGVPPDVDLDGRWFKFVDDFEKAFAADVPSLAECRSLKVEGPVRFAEGTRLAGDVVIRNESETWRELPPGTYADGSFSV